ncbi:MAG: S-layer protein [DPANN group archaeon]|nr:S-layer protein [DPANN group archaeon]
MKPTYSTIIFTFLIIVLSLINVNTVSASTYNADSPYLRVVAEEISPEPVEPGQDVTVKIRLINDGGESAEDVSLKLNAGYPFFIKTESNNFENKRSLCVGCSIDNTYYLVVDANAKSGLYPLNFEIYRDGITIKPSDTIDIKVVGKPDIILETKQIEANVSSGDKFTINFDAKNIGTGIARKIKITPQSDNILMLGSNINLINEINPEKTVSFNLEFIVKESLTPDTYKFPINLEYVDEQGSSYETSFDIGVNVLERSNIDIQSLKITPSFPTLVDEVHMEGIIENTGTGDADNVVVELITQRNKTYKTFIGQLKSDDDAPFYFDVKPESIGVQTATLRISYSDDFGHHSFETTIDKEVKRPTNNLITLLVVLLFVGVGAGYFYYKKKKTKK